MKELKNLKSDSKKSKIFENKKKSFNIFNCKKTEFKDWFDPL
jgi:hypothetical protein